MDNLQYIKENPQKYGKSCSIEELETLLTNASNSYYNSDTCIISDIVYDILIDILQERNSSSSVLSSVGFTIDDEKTKSNLYTKININETYIKEYASKLKSQFPKRDLAEYLDFAEFIEGYLADPLNFIN